MTFTFLGGGESISLPKNWITGFYSTVCHKKNVPNFQMKKVWLFFRSIFSKFCMQVDMTFIIAYIKSEKSPRMATLTYRHFGNPGRCYHRAHCTIVHRKAWLELFSRPLNMQNSSNARKCRSRRPRRAAAGGRPLAAAIFLTLYM